MAINFPASITGAAQTGFTSPTYTLVTDIAPDSFGIQRAVSALGGTQVGVDAHSISRPFTLTFVRPKKLQVLEGVSGQTSVLRVPMNRYGLLTRKGVTPFPNQPSKVASISTEFKIPAGADITDAANLRAMISAHIGALWIMAAGIGDTTVSGTY